MPSTKRGMSDQPVASKQSHVASAASNAAGSATGTTGTVTRSNGAHTTEQDHQIMTILANMSQRQSASAQQSNTSANGSASGSGVGSPVDSTAKVSETAVDSGPEVGKAQKSAADNKSTSSKGPQPQTSSVGNPSSTATSASVVSQPFPSTLPFSTGSFGGLESTSSSLNLSTGYVPASSAIAPSLYGSTGNGNAGFGNAGAYQTGVDSTGIGSSIYSNFTSTNLPGSLSTNGLAQSPASPPPSTSATTGRSSRQETGASGHAGGNSATSANLAAAGSRAIKNGSSNIFVNSGEGQSTVDALHDSDLKHAGSSSSTNDYTSGSGTVTAGATAAARRGTASDEKGVETEWSRARKDNHKEVERRRRETINEGINELKQIVPGCEKNKGSILKQTVVYIKQLQESERQLQAAESANIEKWTLEKVLLDQAAQSARDEAKMWMSMQKDMENERNAAIDENKRLKAELAQMRGDSHRTGSGVVGIKRDSSSRPGEGVGTAGHNNDGPDKKARLG